MDYQFLIDSFDERKVIEEARKWVRDKNVSHIRCVPSHINFGILMFNSQLPEGLYTHKNLSSEERSLLEELKPEIEFLRLQFSEKHSNGSKDDNIDKFLHIKLKVSEILGDDRRKCICKTFPLYLELKHIVSTLETLNRKLNHRLRNRCAVCGIQMAKVVCCKCKTMYCSSKCRKEDRDRHLSDCGDYVYK